MIAHLPDRAAAPVGLWVVSLLAALALQGAAPAGAGAATWVQLQTSGSPATQFNCAPIYDPINRRKLVFAGLSLPRIQFQNAYVSTLDLNTRVWDTPVPSGPIPPDRPVPIAVYDPIRQRMVAFGGGLYDGLEYTLNDVWELQLPAGGALTWRELATQGAPSPRQGPVTVYDPVRDRMLLFGGATAPAATNEVWGLNFSDDTWHLIATSGAPPSGRAFATGIYDPYSDRLVVYGGSDNAGAVLSDTWELSLAGTPTWAQLPVSGPPPYACWWRAVLDPVRQRMLYLLSDLEIWALDLVGPPAWQLLDISGASDATDVSAPIYDPVEDRVISEANGDPYHEIPHTTWALYFDSPVPTQIALIGFKARPDRVELSWGTGGAELLSPVVERRTEGSDWSMLASASAEGRDRVIYVDRSVTSGGHYAYRLSYSNADGQQTTSEVWVDVPSQGLSLAIPNPIAGDMAVTFSLVGSDPARIEAYDVSGRRVLTREVGSLGAGTHRLNLTDGVQLPPGVYAVRLLQAGHQASARVVLAR